MTMRHINPFGLVIFCLIAGIFAPEYSLAGKDKQLRYEAAVEVRAVWLDRRSIPCTESGIREMVRRYTNAGINLIFPEVIYNGYSAYKSAYLVQKDLWNGIDALSILIRECHKSGIEVHPWVWVFRAGYKDDKGGILSNHPEWAAHCENGDAPFPDGSYWICPSSSDARAFLINAYKELVRKYDIDGIHLDYVRYPDQGMGTSCICPNCVGKFMNEVGIDPRLIQPYTKQTVDWQMWRERLINSFVSDCSKELRKIKPSLMISASVVPSCNIARLSYMQNWINWVDNRWVDFIVLMNYTPDNMAFMRRLDEAVYDVNYKTLIVSGVGLHITSVEQALKQIVTARLVCTNGVSLFSASYLGPNILDNLEYACTRSAALPFRDPASKAEIMKHSAIARMTNLPLSPLDLVFACLDANNSRALASYSEYRSVKSGYVPPTKPPIFIPSIIKPVPSMHAARVDAPPIVDGIVDRQWLIAAPYWITASNLGKPIAHKTQIRMVYDNENVYLLFIVYEPYINSIKASINTRDAQVFNDDSIEIFLNATGSSQNRHFVVNALGTQYDEIGFDKTWNAEWDCATYIGKRYWIAEIRIPYEALGSHPPEVGDMWSANFCHNRHVGTDCQYSCWSATYGPYNNSKRFGRIVFSSRK